MEIRSLHAEDLEQAWELDRYAFHSAPKKRDSYMHWDPARLTGAFENGRLLGSWASEAEFITYPCGPEDSALLLMPEQKARVRVEVRWMTRIVDAIAAVEARGFPQGLEGEAHLEILDPILPNHAGRFV